MNPATASNLRNGKGKVGKLRDPSASKREWAKIAPKDREKILQSKTEGFPAEFDDVLSDYFRQVSKEDAGK